MDSLETVATIRKEFPQVQVLVVDENERNKLEWNLGGEVARRISTERERQGGVGGYGKFI